MAWVGISPGTGTYLWARALRIVGVEHLHFRDLHHPGNTLAAATGASTKELMARRPRQRAGGPDLTAHL